MRRAYFEFSTTRHLPLSRRDLRRHLREGSLAVLPPEARKHQLLVGVFVIDHEQPLRGRIPRTGQGEIAEEVVVVAELQFLRGPGLTARIEFRRARQHRIAPADQHVGVVAFGDMVIGIEARLQFLEYVARWHRTVRGSGEGQRAHRGCDGGDAERALQHVAPVETAGDDIAQRGVRARVAASVLRFLGLLRTGQDSLGDFPGH
jgi:hypothetical protein